MSTNVGGFHVGVAEACKARRLKKDLAAAVSNAAANAGNSAATAALAAAACATNAAAPLAVAVVDVTNTPAAVAAAVPAATAVASGSLLVAANRNRQHAKKQGNRKTVASVTSAAVKMTASSVTTTGALAATRIAAAPAAVSVAAATTAIVERQPVVSVKRRRVNKRKNGKAGAAATVTSVVGAASNAVAESPTNTTAGPTAVPVGLPVQTANPNQRKQTTTTTRPKEIKAAGVDNAQTDASAANSVAAATPFPVPLVVAVDTNRQTGAAKKSKKNSANPSSSAHQNRRQSTNRTGSKKQNSTTRESSSRSPTTSPSSRKVPGAALFHRNRREPQQTGVPLQRAQPSTSDSNTSNEMETKEEVYAALPSKHKNGQVIKNGSKLWMEVFPHIEKFFDKGNFEIKVFPNGLNFEVNIGDFKHVMLFEDKEGLELVIPDDLDFDTVPRYVGTGDETLSVICSGTGKNESLTIQQLVDCFKIPKGERRHTLNLLSLESDQANTDLATKIQVPQFVRNNSLIKKLEIVLEKRKQEVRAEFKTTHTKKGKKQLRHKLSKIVNMKNSMPKYQKFLLLSMENSFTDIHVDFSATSVFYHVKRGKKIFYVAPPTASNIQVYKDFEEGRRDDDEWIGAELFDQWRRVEIKAGQTAMIPSGWLHFVYTPEDSVVVGGNFLMDQHIQQQFDLTELEERCVKDGSLTYDHTFKGFRNVMWAYLKYLLTPQFKAAPSPGLAENIEICLAHLDVEQEIEDDWFEKDEKEGIKKQAKLELETWNQNLNNQRNQHVQRQMNSENQPSTSDEKNKKRPATRPAGNGSNKKARLG